MAPAGRRAMMKNVSPLAWSGSVVVLVFFALAAALWIPAGAESTQRLGMFFALCGTAVAGLLGALRADQAKHQTNGGLEERIQAAIARALSARRSSDDERIPR